MHKKLEIRYLRGGYLVLSWVVYYSLVAPRLVHYRKRMRKPPPRKTSNWLRTTEVASILGISQRTLMRKLAAGTLPEPARDASNNYRLWRPEEVEAIHQQLLKDKT